MQGEVMKVLKALEAKWVGHPRKFLVDHSVLPLFEKTQSLKSVKWRPGLISHHCIMHIKVELALSIHLQQGGNLCTWNMNRNWIHILDTLEFRSMGKTLNFKEYAHRVARASGPIVTQVAQTMQIPISYAEDIIGIGGNSIEHIRRTSGAIITVQESRGLPDEITVEIKGSSSQVQMAQQLIQEFMNNHKEPVTSSYGKIDTGYRSSYSHLGSSSYSSSSLSSQPYGGYGSSGVGGYGSSGVGGYSSYRL
ncbi:hypothetical protein Pint_14003 [Pistacia integerrima]|uniref:Uncharacterized protein n=1 Tax=Pistacia integerrima TaxID=434235 RepID=A0ACC0Y8I2_9ROSI|nr:hypothetical protein Pint_14003 [Pistacia integerrima]